MTEQAAQDPNMPPMDEPEATEQTEATATPETEGQAETATAPVEKEEGQFVSPEDISEKTQKRINKITAEKYAEKREKEALQAEVEKLKSQVQPVTQTSNADEPKLEDFEYDEAAHTSALIDYRVNLKAEQIQQQQQQATSQAQARQTSDSFNTKVAEFEQKATDYQQVVANIPQLPEETLNAVMQSDKGPELAYYLGKHLDVADEIATASPMVAAMKLGQISVQLSATVTATKTSAAPDPIEPIESGSSLSKKTEDMSMDEIWSS
jgi:chromosome segregation ATPase